MTSRLASLLVQEGLVSAKKMAEAFQRQVIYGGTLDTMLLEMEILDEDVILDALARASGIEVAWELPPARELAGAHEWLSQESMERFRAAPVAFGDGTLRVLVTDPVDRAQLDELGYQLGCSVEPRITPEHRFAQLVEMVYGMPVAARLASLSAKLAKRPRPTVMAAHPVRTRSRRTIPAVSSGSGRTIVSDVPMPTADEEPAPRPIPRQVAAPAQPIADVALRLDMRPPVDATPLALDEAKRRIEQAADRDAIFESLCRAARSQLEFAALLTVHGDVAAGRLGLGATWLGREALARVAVPLDRPSPFRAAIQGRAPYLGRLGEEAIGAEALTALGRKPPLAGVLVPIVLRDRAVALLYGDSDGAPLDASLLADLTTTVAAAARSFQRLILRAKGGDYAKPAPALPTEEPMAPAESARRLDDGQPTQRRSTLPGFPVLSHSAAGELASRRSNGNAHSIHEEPTEKIIHAGSARPSGDLQALVDSVAAADARAGASAEALLSAGERGALAVVARLPGPLHLERHTLRGPTPPLADHGPLLGLLARFGDTATSALLARTGDPAVEVRYYAVLGLGRLRSGKVVQALGMRLFDPDASVRHIALEMLATFEPSVETRTLGESLRGDLPGPDVTRQRLAAGALGAFHDVPSVPRLIELVKHADEAVVSAARQALIEITKQDFGASRWRWRSWWEHHRHESRLEWMLEGLAHPEAEVRLSASEELRGLTPEYFGYHFDLPKREREEARRKWVDWWRDQPAKVAEKGPLR